jgi:hypothetical protein
MHSSRHWPLSVVSLTARSDALLHGAVVAAEFGSDGALPFLVRVHHFDGLPLAFAVPGFDLVKLVREAGAAVRGVGGALLTRGAGGGVSASCVGLFDLLVPRYIRDALDALYQRVVLVAMSFCPERRAVVRLAQVNGGRVALVGGDKGKG